MAEKLPTDRPIDVEVAQLDVAQIVGSAKEERILVAHALIVFWRRTSRVEPLLEEQKFDHLVWVLKKLLLVEGGETRWNFERLPGAGFEKKHLWLTAKQSLFIGGKLAAEPIGAEAVYATCEIGERLGGKFSEPRNVLLAV